MSSVGEPGEERLGEVLGELGDYRCGAWGKSEVILEDV